MQIEKNATVYISFPPPMFPRRFVLYSGNGQVYYWRYLDGKTPRIKFNIVDGDDYKGNVPFDVVKVVPIEIPNNLPALPPFERDRVQDLKIVDNLELEGTPARIHTLGPLAGTVERGNSFRKHPRPLRLFFLLHEIGHLYYKTEEYCDLYAFIHFLRMGYNRSTAFYAISHVLSPTPRNKQRLNFLLSQIDKTQKNVTNKIA